MNPRELIVLSPYRIPAKDSLMLSDEDVAALMNGYTALWHPLALRGSTAPPRVASPYDHETPTPGHVYAVPDSPPVFLPDDWRQRVNAVGAATFQSTADRDTSLANMKEALRGLAERTANRDDEHAGNTDDDRRLHDLPESQARPFLGIGFGTMHVDALFEAMDHDNLLDKPELWKEIQAGVNALLGADPESYRASLKAAADRLLLAREALYPVSIHIIDLCLCDEIHLGQGTQPQLPAALENGEPLNLVVSGQHLEKLGQDHPEILATLRERAKTKQVEVCLGAYLEREDALLPMESQMWNLLKGKSVARKLLETDIRVYARKRLAAHPRLPLLLSTAGLNRAVLLSFDESSLPAFRTPVVGWSSPDGRRIEAFTRSPRRADTPQTFFHVAHYLQQTISQDHAATFALLHRGAAASPWYVDWLELNKFAPVLGKWIALSAYFDEVVAGEDTSSDSADEFHSDHLSERVEGHVERPISGFAEQARGRRDIDTAWTLAAFHRGLAGSNDRLRLDAQLTEIEDQFELGADVSSQLTEVCTAATAALAERLLARATSNEPGYLLLNACGYARRTALEVDGMTVPLPIGGPIKACQLDGDKAKLVIEIPALGFAWFPKNGPPGTPPQASRMKLADERHVRNEFFEAEIDPTTGGLRGIWDQRTRINRLGQLLVYNPGSTMQAQEVLVTSSGPALGEVISSGVILDEQQQVLARFRQRYRAWLGRPVLDLRIEIFPEQPPTGYAWHSYYGARFAWRDERAHLLRGVQGSSYVTAHTRPTSPEYVEWRSGKQSTTLFTAGLPFQQRHGSRMLDVILLPEGESCRCFDLALGLEREFPMLTAQGLISPTTLVPVAKGPPHIGPTGWLFHLDSPNLVLTSLRPAPDGADSITARMRECCQHGGTASFRCTRDPKQAMLLDARGEPTGPTNLDGDAVTFEASVGDFINLKIDF